MRQIIPYINHISSQMLTVQSKILLVNFGKLCSKKAMWDIRLSNFLMK